MNPRIKELAIEARLITVDGVTRYALDDEFETRFAELIVSEVLAVQEQLIADGHNAWHLHKPTKEHFQVAQ